MSRRRSLIGIVLAVSAALVCTSRPSLVGADSGTPTVGIAISPEPATAIPPTSAPVATEPVSREQATVGPTIPAAREGMVPTATAAAEHPPVQGPAASSSVQTSSPVPAYVPLPSPEQLRLNARLRWGDRVPDSVRRWAFLIVPAARANHLDPNLIAAVITMESDGDPLAWNSGSDARGLMQVLHGPWDPKQNIATGSRMLSDFYDQFHDLDLTLAAYNAGPNAVLHYGGVPPYRETRDYVVVVSYLYDLYANHALTGRRKALYNSTLRDLRHFADQRKKVKALARAAGVPESELLLCYHLSSHCDEQPAHVVALFQTMDPFWPAPGQPDPLQQVKPSSLHA